jgi:hypothetical protein
MASVIRRIRRGVARETLRRHGRKLTPRMWRAVRTVLR